MGGSVQHARRSDGAPVAGEGRRPADGRPGGGTSAVGTTGGPSTPAAVRYGAGVEVYP